MMVWMSDNTSLRTYIRSSRTFSPSELPPALASRLADADKNGVPDSIENMSREKLSEEYKKMGDGTSLLPQRPFFQANYSSDDRLLTLDFDQDAEA
jgi:hypothetical protein